MTLKGGGRHRTERVRLAVYLTLAALALLLAGAASDAHAQGEGEFGRPFCTQITSPVASRTWCREYSTLALKVYTGGSPTSPASYTSISSTILNGLAGAVTLQGTPNQVNVVTAGSAITLSLPQSLAPGNTPSFNNLILTGIAVGSTRCLQLGATGLIGVAAGACGVFSSIGGQTGPVVTAGANDTNVTLTWAANTVTPGWAGTLAQARGGFGANVSAVNGVVSVSAGTFIFNNVLTANRVLYAAAGNTVTSSANLTFNGTTLVANALTVSALVSGGTQCVQVNSAGTLAGSGVACGGGGGGGTVTNTGTLTANAFILGNAGVDVTALALTGFVKGNGASAPTASATIPTSGGGLGADVSALSGVVSLNAGAAVVNNVLTATRLLYAAAGNTVTSSANLTFNGTTLTLLGLATGSTTCLQIDSVGVVGVSGAACGGGGGAGVSSINTTATGGVTIQGTANQVTVGTAGSALTLGLTNPISVDTTGNAATATVASGLPAGAAGRIPFYTGVNAIGNDAANAWNNTDKRLVINNNASSPLPPITSTVTVRQQWVSPSGNATSLQVDAYGNQAELLFVRTNGTPASPTALATNNPIGAVQFLGHDGVNLSIGQGSFGCFAGSAWTGSSHETFCTIGVTASGSTALVEAVRVLSTRALQLAVPLPVTSGGLGIASGTSGGVPYFSAATTVASSALLVNRGMVVGGGAGAAPRGLTALTNGQLYFGSTGADPVPGSITSTTISATPGAGTLALDVTGILGGATNRVPFWTTSTAIGNSSAFTWDNGNARLAIVGQIRAQAASSNAVGGYALIHNQASLRMYLSEGPSTGQVALSYNTRANLGLSAYTTPDNTTEAASWTMEFGGLNPGVYGPVDYFAIKRAPITVGVPTFSTFFYVSPTGSIGVGTGAPAAKLDVRGAAIFSTNAGTLPVPPLGALQISVTTGSDAAVTMEGFAGQGALVFRRANGTPAAPSAILLDQPIGSIQGWGYGASAYSGSARASVGMFASENWTNVAQGAFSTIGYTPIGSTTLTEAARLGAPPTAAFVGTTSNGSTTISSITPISSLATGNGPTTGISAGARVTGPGITAGTTVATVGANSLTMSAPATATATINFAIGSQPTLLRLAPVVTGDVTTPSLMVYGADGAATNGTWFPIYAAGAFIDAQITPGAGSTVPSVALTVRNRYNFNSSAGGTVGILSHSEWTGTISNSLHSEVYGIASLNVLNPSSLGSVSQNAFHGIASQIVVKGQVDGIVQVIGVQLANTVAPGAGGTHGITIVNGVDNAPSDLVTATDAIRIGAKAGSGAGVESWINAFHLRDNVTNASRFRIANADGRLTWGSGTLPYLSFESGTTVGFAVLDTANAFAIVSPSGATNGASMVLAHVGVANPNKYVRSHSGSLEFLNNAYTVQMGISDAGQITFPSYGAGGGVMSVGAVDSCGVGFRCLRVPN